MKKEIFVLALQSFLLLWLIWYTANFWSQSTPNWYYQGFLRSVIFVNYLPT